MTLVTAATRKTSGSSRRTAIAHDQPIAQHTPKWAAIGDTGSATARAFAVLDAVAQAQGPVAAADLAPKLGLPRATVHRIALHLEELGLLQREPGSKRFVVGPHLQMLALDSLINSSWRGERHAILQALVDEVGETCNVTVLDGNEVVYIDRVEAQWPLRTHMHPGSRVPLHCGASGKVFLSFMPAYKRRRLLRSVPLKRFTDRTEIDPEKIEQELQTIRKTKVGVDDEEFLPGLVGLAVPVFDARDRVCATVSLHVPTVRLDAKQALRHVPALARAAQAVSRTLDPAPRQAQR